MSRERPILMSGPLVRAILAGAKTQTRRVIKPKPRNSFKPELLDDWEWKSPYGDVGDRLWVRETWCLAAPYTWNLPMTVARARVQAYSMDENGHAKISGKWHPDDAAYYRASFDRSPPSRWIPSIHMPRWASRIDLEVTGIRVERLREISEEDAKAEGVGHGHAPTYRDGFRILWDAINGKRSSWASNPFVWVVEFRRMRP